MGFSGASLYHAHMKETLGMRKKLARSRFQTGIIQQATPKDEQTVNYQFRWTRFISIIEYIESEISILKKVAVLSQIIIEGAWPPPTKLLGGASAPGPPSFAAHDHYYITFLKYFILLLLLQCDRENRELLEYVRNVYCPLINHIRGFLGPKMQTQHR